MQRKITLLGANYVFFAFVALFMVFQLVLIFFTVIYGEEFLNNNIYRILLINEFVLILLPVLVYTVKNRLNLKETFRFRKLGLAPAAVILLLSVPAYFVALMLNNAVVYVLQFFGNIPSQPIPVPKTIPELLIGIAIVAVSPAICEELLHRGILLKGYENRGSLKAVMVTALYFGIFHFDITNLLGPIFLGLLIGYYVIRTNSIFAGMLAHFLNNTIAELFQYFMGEDSQTKNVTVSGEEMAALLFYGAASLVVCGLLIYLFNIVTRRGAHALRAPIATVGGDARAILTHWPIIVILALYVFMSGIYLLSIFLSKLYRLF